ncbi:MAG: carbamoyltransferase [bacterium]|nr:carbamoyltransferase [bacterium]
MLILGISAFYHDSAAALVLDGDIVAAAQEERFTRKKHDPGFPSEAIKYCLNVANVKLEEIDYVVFYDKPLVKFERLLETYLAFAPQGFRSFVTAMPIWLKEKLYLKDQLKRDLSQLAGIKRAALPPLLFDEHHHAHAASAFFPSPFEEAAVLCLDGVGEWATASVWHGQGNQVKAVKEIRFPHSLGLLYSAFTYYCGFKVNSGEYKLMGLAPYGEPKYVEQIEKNLIHLHEDGSFQLNMKYFNFATGLTMTNRAFDQLFGGPPRKGESEVTQREMDMAASVQVVTEKAVIRLATQVKQELGVKHLCLAGGVALNCVANGKLWKEKIFDEIWIQPASGDAGGALGAALSVWYEYLENPRQSGQDQMKGAYLGPQYSAEQIARTLDNLQAQYQVLESQDMHQRLAEILADEKVVGWFQGRMEFGPRALGGRSIIGDPRSQKMQSVMNLKIKYRESFRPFAPAVRAEKVSEWFEYEGVSPYMLMVAEVKKDKQLPMTEAQMGLFGIEKLNVPRSDIPAVTHVDYSARLQTVHQETNPAFYGLLEQFENKTGCPVLINTSFNVRGEPIVSSPEDAYRCFMRTEMDYLVVENYLLEKSAQPAWKEQGDWRNEFELD